MFYDHDGRVVAFEGAKPAGAPAGQGYIGSTVGTSSIGTGYVGATLAPGQFTFGNPPFTFGTERFPYSDYPYANPYWPYGSPYWPYGLATGPAGQASGSLTTWWSSEPIVVTSKNSVVGFVVGLAVGALGMHLYKSRGKKK